MKGEGAWTTLEKATIGHGYHLFYQTRCSRLSIDFSFRDKEEQLVSTVHQPRFCDMLKVMYSPTKDKGIRSIVDGCMMKTGFEKRLI